MMGTKLISPVVSSRAKMKLVSAFHSQIIHSISKGPSGRKILKLHMDVETVKKMIRYYFHVGFLVTHFSIQSRAV